MNQQPLRVKAVFDQALEIDSPVEREAYLKRVCADAPDIRRQVEALVRAYQEAGSFLESPASAMVASVDNRITERPGTVIGPYKLMEQIGEGGMGLVFVADQQHPVRRKVALKVIKPGMDTRAVVARFEAERQALALMDHPNIAKVLDGGETTSGRPYFVMELVKGVPITEYCDENRLAPCERLELFIHVCEAVQHAHQKGIIHRDIKPSNVLVVSHDSKPVVRVIDFGLAKAIGQQLTDKTVYTQFDQLMGTPLYMSPEQAGESSLDVDTRSDIYSLGVLLYELLTGTTPFDKERFKQVGYDEICRIIREEDPPKPSTRISTLGPGATLVSTQRKTDPKRLSQLFRGELDWIVMKCLEKDRNRRYESANGLALDLMRYLRDEPVQACPPSASYRLRKFALRNKVLLAFGACALLALAGLAGGVGWAVRDRSARETERGLQETARRVEVDHQVRASLAAAQALVAENRLALAREKLAEAKGRLGADAFVLSGLLSEIEAWEAELARYEEFLDLIDRARESELLFPLEAVLFPKASPGLKPDAPSADKRDQYPGPAVSLMLQALSAYAVMERDDWSSALDRSLLGPEHVVHIRHAAYEQLVWLAQDVLGRERDHQSGSRMSRETASRQALVYLQKAETARPPTLAFFRIRARCYENLQDKPKALAAETHARETPAAVALDYYLLGREARRAHNKRDAAQLLKAALRQDPAHYWSMMSLGACLHDLEQKESWAEAAGIFTACIMRRPNHAAAYTLRGFVHLRLQRYEDARTDLSKSIELNPKDAEAWRNRGVACYSLNRPDEAVADFHEALCRNPNLAEAYMNLGNVFLYCRGRTDDAIAAYQKAIDLKPGLAEAHVSLGNALREKRRTDEAIAAIQTGLRLNSNDPQFHLDLGRAWRDKGRWDEAIGAYQQALRLDRKFVPAYMALGALLCDQKHDYEAAVAAFRAAILLAPNYPDPHFNLGNALWAQGKLADAESAYREAIHIKMDFANAHNQLGVVLQAQRRLNEAEAAYRQAIRHNPKHFEAQCNLGVIAFERRQFKEAEIEFRKAIDLNARHTSARFNLGNTLQAQGRLPEAEAAYRQAILLRPDDADIRNNLSNVLRAAGKLDDAETELRQAIRLKPDHVRARFNLARLLRSKAKVGDAITQYQEVIRRQPDHAPALNELAWLRATCANAEHRDPAEAVRLAKKAVQLAQAEAAYWNTLGTAHYYAKDWKAAIAALEKSMALSKGGDAHDWLFLAMAHWQLGDKDTARQWYDRAAEWTEKKQPNDAELRRFRAEAAELLKLKEKRN